jgi:hypothetical protein
MYLHLLHLQIVVPELRRLHDKSHIYTYYTSPFDPVVLYDVPNFDHYVHTHDGTGYMTKAVIYLTQYDIQK